MVISPLAIRLINVRQEEQPLFGPVGATELVSMARFSNTSHCSGVSSIERRSICFTAAP
jgi:hypothetical protein